MCTCIATYKPLKWNVVIPTQTQLQYLPVASQLESWQLKSIVKVNIPSSIPATICNSFNTIGYLLEVFFRLWIPFLGPYFYFCLELVLKTWAKASLTLSSWVDDPNHTHSLASFQCSGLSDKCKLHLTECCLQVQKWCPYKGKGVVPELVCANKVRNGPPSANQGFSTATKGSCHQHGTLCWNPPTSTYPVFFASAKPIFKTDCANCMITCG